jgi:hypothetical protein
MTARDHRTRSEHTRLYTQDLSRDHKLHWFALCNLPMRLIPLHVRSAVSERGAFCQKSSQLLYVAAVSGGDALGRTLHKQGDALLQPQLGDADDRADVR